MLLPADDWHFVEMQVNIADENLPKMIHGQYLFYDGINVDRGPILLGTNSPISRQHCQRLDQQCHNLFSAYTRIYVGDAYSVPPISDDKPDFSAAHGERLSIDCNEVNCARSPADEPCRGRFAASAAVEDIYGVLRETRIASVVQT